jgi:hypothetical protein
LDQRINAEEEQFLLFAEQVFAYLDILIREVLRVGRKRLLVPVRLLKIFAFKRTGKRDFALGTATQRANVSVNCRARTPGAALPAYLA